MMQNGTRYADKGGEELNLESVAYELKNLVDARIEIDREGGFVAVKNPTENELSNLSDYVNSSDSVRGYPIREEEKLIVEPCSGGDGYVL
jgi:hypothetical protein